MDFLKNKLHRINRHYHSLLLLRVSISYKHEPLYNSFTYPNNPG